MPKDPAFLFYSEAFITGTMTMTNEQRGKYIMLLCLQHQKGLLRKKDMLSICGSYDEDIFEKFEQDDDGMFFNKRLFDEMEKRRNYAESRRRNASKKSDSKKDSEHKESICPPYAEHIKDINKDINKIKDKKKKYAEFVLLKEEEYQKLVAKHGEFWVKKMIEKLDNYKGAKGAKYKSDYRAILSWVEKEVKDSPEYRSFMTKKMIQEAQNRSLSQNDVMHKVKNKIQDIELINKLKDEEEGT